MPDDPLGQFEPTSDRLTRLAAEAVDDSMLREIAEADYGQDAAEHLKQLRAIKNGAVLAPMEWVPKEVLELIRWSEPEDPSWTPGATGQRGHRMRLFACAALLRAAAEPENDGSFLGEDSTVIQLVDSALKLDVKTSRASLQFLGWSMQARKLGDWDQPFFALGVLLLAVSLRECDTSLATYLIAAASPNDWTRPDIFRGCIKKQTWITRTRSLLVDSSDTSAELREFGKILLGD